MLAMEDELDAILAEYSNFDLQLEPNDFGSTFSNFDPVPGYRTYLAT